MDESSHEGDSEEGSQATKQTKNGMMTGWIGKLGTGIVFHVCLPKVPRTTGKQWSPATDSSTEGREGQKQNSSSVSLQGPPLAALPMLCNVCNVCIAF